MAMPFKRGGKVCEPKRRPELLSLLSLIAVSASPTSVTAGKPLEISTSISTGYACIPNKPKLKTLESMLMVFLSDIIDAMQGIF